MRATAESVLSNHYAQRDPGLHFVKEDLIVLQPDTTQDAGGLLTPNVVTLPGGGFRLYYMGRNARSAGIILSAYSADGFSWQKEAGVRVANDAVMTQKRALCPDVILLPDGRWRMYFEALPATGSGVIASAISANGLDFELEPGARFATTNVHHGAPRCLPLPDGRWRLYFHAYPQPMKSGLEAGNHIVSAISENGLDFKLEPGVRIAQTDERWECYAVYAPEIIRLPDQTLRMYFGAWNNDRNRGRIFAAHSLDGLHWQKDGMVIDCGAARDFIFASEPCLHILPAGDMLLYYEACDAQGVCRILSARASFS